MLISKTFERINHCIELSESMNLTNSEEKNITIELARNFQKLLPLILTKDEQKKIKQKNNLITKINKIKYLKNQISLKKRHPSYYCFLSIQSNLFLLTMPRHSLTRDLIYNDLSNLIFSKKKFTQSMTYHLLTNNDCSTINNINKIFDSLTKQIQTYNIQHIIIPSKYFLSFGATAILNLIELLANQIHGSIIIDLSTHQHFEEAKKTIQHILSQNKKIFIGISIPLNHKKSIKNIHSLINHLDETQHRQLIIHTKKVAHFNYEPKKKYIINFSTQEIKLNAYYKWSIYTIMNMTRKKKFKIIINSSNIFDIAWILTQRAQMNIEKKVSFETSEKNYETSKLLNSFGNLCVKTKPLLLDENTTKNLTIILDKIIEDIESTSFKKTINQKQVFKKSHHQFFLYLKRNFLEKYLNKFED